MSVDKTGIMWKLSAILYLLDWRYSWLLPSTLRQMLPLFSVSSEKFTYFFIVHTKFIYFKIYMLSEDAVSAHPLPLGSCCRVDQKVFTCHLHLVSSSTYPWTFSYYGLSVHVSLFFSLSISHGWLTQNACINIKTTPINRSLYILSTQFSTGNPRCWAGTTVILHSHCFYVSPALKDINNDFSICFWL